MKQTVAIIVVLTFVGVFGVLILTGIQTGYIDSLAIGDVALLKDGSNNMEADLDMDENYVTKFPLEDWIHLTMEKGVTDVHITSIPAGVHVQDRHYFRLMASLDVAPGVDKIVSFTISDGTNSMSVSLTGAETDAVTTTGAFDLDVSAETFTLTYNQTAGGLTDHACVMMHWWYKENE